MAFFMKKVQVVYFQPYSSLKPLTQKLIHMISLM